MQPTDQTSIADAWALISSMFDIPLRTTAHIVGEAQHDLRRAVPPRRNVLGHEALLLLLVEAASETKVADLELAVCVDEKVTGFEITVKDIRRVNVLQTA